QDVPFEISLQETAIVSHFIADRIGFWPWPILFVPFAEALREPDTLVEILCAFLQISPGESERKQAASFVQPLTRGYRPFDAKPDQLHDFSPLERKMARCSRSIVGQTFHHGARGEQRNAECNWQLRRTIAFASRPSANDPSAGHARRWAASDRIWGTLTN